MLQTYEAEALTLLSSLLWGTSFAAVKMGLEQLNPLWFMEWRLLLASLLLVPFYWTKGLWPSYLRNFRIWRLGFFNGAGFLLQYLGMQYTTASKAAFFVNFGFIFVAILSYFFLQEAFGKWKFFGLGMAFLGVFLLSTGGDVASWRQGNPAGDGMVLAAGLLWAVYMVLTKKTLMEPNIRVAPLTAAVMFTSSMWFLLPVLIWGRLAFAGTVTGWAILVYCAVFCTVIPALLWAKALRSMMPTVSAVILLAEPVFASIIAFIVLGERFAPVEIIGALMILAAMFLVSFGEEKKELVLAASKEQ